MKKLLVSILAVAALAACTKSDVIYDEPSEITVSPVSGNITKAMMEGKTFHTTQIFNVWAWYKQLPAGTTISDWQASSEKQQEYIKGSPFINRKKDNAATTSWGGVTPYYWPKLGSLLFAGYYPTTIADNVSYTFNGSVNKMEFTNIEPTQVGTSTNDFSEDIMYFNMTATSAESGPVAVEFKHALSWITVNVAKTAGSPKIVIDEIKFTDVYASGNGTVNGEDDITWECIKSDSQNNVIAAVPKIIAKNHTLLEVTTQTVNGKTVNVLEKLSTEPLLIPQVMNGDLYIKYTVFASNTESFTEEYKLSLKSTTTTPNKWEPGKHYIYNVTIGTTEILIDPSVVDWVEEEIEVTVD